MAIEDFFIEQDTLSVPNGSFFELPTIPQRFIDEARGDIVVQLTNDDYVAVAARLNVDVAAIKAVVEIETGKQHKGFMAPRKPIIYFDAKVFRRNCQRRGVDVSGYKIVSGHGVNQERAHQRLQAACEIDSVIAQESTFWGMFQIGGFNWKLCGAKDLGDFVYKMRYSERTQLELFAGFLENTGLVKYLQTKKWSAFAYRYNGPKYARRGYHTRLARAYNKYRSMN